MSESLEGTIQAIHLTKGEAVVSTSIGSIPSAQNIKYIVKEETFIFPSFLTTKIASQMSFNPHSVLLISNDEYDLRIEGRGKVIKASEKPEWKKEMLKIHPYLEKQFDHPFACFLIIKPVKAQVTKKDILIVDESLKGLTHEYPENKQSTTKTMVESFKLQIKTWARIIRVPFWTATIVPVILGLTMAYSDGYEINWQTWILTLLFTIMAHSAANIFNDYFDHINGGDQNNQFWSPMNGGSRVIQLGIASPNKMLVSATLFYSGSILIFSYLYSINEDIIFLLIGIAGFITVLFYNLVIKIGLGEVFIFFGFGPILVFTSYFVQTGTLTPEVIYVSVPIGILISLVLFINGFQDYQADSQVNKRTLVVMLKSKKNAAIIYHIAVALVYLMVIIGIIINYFPIYSLLAFLPIIFAIKASSTLRKHYNSIIDLYPANGATIVLHLTTGILLSIAFMLDKMI